MLKNWPPSSQYGSLISHTWQARVSAVLAHLVPGDLRNREAEHLTVEHHLVAELLVCVLRSRDDHRRCVTSREQGSVTSFGICLEGEQEEYRSGVLKCGLGLYQMSAFFPACVAFRFFVRHDAPPCNSYNTYAKTHPMSQKHCMAIR